MLLSNSKRQRVFPLVKLLLLALLPTGALLTTAAPAWAIEIEQVDDFQDGTMMNWFGADPRNESDAGPTGAGDHALSVESTGSIGSVGKLLVTNFSDHWTGNWTATGVAQVAMDVRNPNTFPLMMRAGLAGPDGSGVGGFGDTYVTTDAVSVPADNAWHSIVIDVLPGDFTFTGGELNVPNIDAALTGVTQFRIVHNNMPAFLGEQIAASMFLDNIRPLAASATLDGDYNENGVVDAADYTMWRDTLGQTGADLPADGTGPGGSPDGVVDVLDYDFWKAKFGNMPSGGGAGIAAAAVPEPAAHVLMLLMSLVLGRLRRSRIHF